MSVRRGLALSALLALLAPPGAEAAPLRRVGVVVQLAVNVPSHRAEALSEAVALAVGRAHGVDTIGGEAAARRLPREGVPEDCLARPACLEDLGARLSSRELLMLVLVSLGDDTQLDVTWVDLDTQQAAPRPGVSFPSDPEAMQAALREAAPGLLPRPVDEAPEVAEAPPPEPEAPAPKPTAPSPPSASPPPSLTATDVAPTSAPVPVAVWVLGGVSAAALLTGAGLGVAALNEKAGLDADGCRNTNCGSQRVDGLARTAMAADIAFGAAALSGVAAALWWYLADDDGLGPTVEAAPLEGGAWLGVGGRL